MPLVAHWVIHPWLNAATEIKELKQGSGKKMIKLKAPKIWDDS